MSTCGCYQSHGLSDAAAPAVDAGPACEFSLRFPDGAMARCSISANSIEGCTEAALCLCDARGPLTSTERLLCASAALAPRALIPLSDFCAEEPPPRMTMAAALERYLAREGLDAAIGDVCDGMPALIGPRPYEGCGYLAGVLCPCGPEPCDLDALLGRACLSLTREEVGCVRRGVPSGEACSVDVRAAVRACGG